MPVFQTQPKRPELPEDIIREGKLILHKSANQVFIVGGSLVGLIGLLGIVGYLFNIHSLKSFLTAIPQEIALSSAISLLLLGVGLVLRSCNQLVSRLCLSAVMAIALYTMIRYFVLARYYVFLPIVKHYPPIPMRFLTAVQLFCVTVGLLLFSRYREKWWAINTLAIIGLWLFATVVFALLGYGVQLPVLFSYVQSLPAIAAFGIVAVVLVQESVVPPGILSPLISNLQRVRTLSIMTLGVAGLILLAGIGVIYIFQKVLAEGATTLETDALFVVFELSTVALAMLVVLLSMRMLFYYESSLRTADALNRLTGELEERVTVRTAELEKLSRQKSQVLSMVSHDLKTPLAALSRFTEILGRGNANMTQNQRDLLGYISEGTTQMRAMVTDVLDRARIESGRVTVRPETFPVEPLVTQLVASIEPLVSERGVSLAVEISPGLQVTADPSLLRQILLNLLSNAVKYNKRNGKIWLRAYEDAGREQVVFTVQDTGIGIPAEKVSRLFTEFYRVGGGMDTIEGTGLGLASTRRLVDLHGGTVSVSSVEGEGSLFKVELPVGALSQADNYPSPND